MLVGTEWIIDAFDCDAEKLRDGAALRRIFAQVVGDLQLKVIDEVWHQFPGERGVTGFNLLSESHLACHTYPEYRTATFNLYCCRTRPEWNWTINLSETLGARKVSIQKVERGEPQSRIQNPKSKIAGGETA
ncbi:MAG TPA: adenosylmethionine decarboxylase [Pyrinomonadaceae bacterium]|nr:adenosylmethionine decarboxylase [Pyrinomonadaceae bacterium]